MKREEYKNSARCLKCGTELIRAWTADGAEVKCSKCGRKYEVMLATGSLQLNELKVEYASGK